MRRLSLTGRLFLAYALFVALSGWFVMRFVLDEVKPAVRQSTEETLVDTANLLAELVRAPLADGTLVQGDMAGVLEAYGNRRPAAQIWGIEKNQVTHRIHVTDARGIVLLDSAGEDVGADFSQWNDVYLTLQGKYGARSTETVPGDERTTVMHVAAPVIDGGRIIGVVTVAKPNHSVAPFIERAQRHITVLAAVLIGLGLAAGAALSVWLSRVIRRLTCYADAVTAGERVTVPELPGGELNALARALETMRAQLDGKAYVERYVQTLTHELKSPLAGIQGAAELLRQDMAPGQRERFLDHIEVETARLKDLSERLLHLAAVEQRNTLEETGRVALATLVDEVLLEFAPRVSLQQTVVEVDMPDAPMVQGEPFLLRQAVANLIDNALAFTPIGGRVRVSSSGGAVSGAASVTLRVFNEGEAIPEYALSRVTERFYSLPRPDTGRKSTGLGLNLVQEVAGLHGGQFSIANRAGGVEAVLVLPRAIAT